MLQFLYFFVIIYISENGSILSKKEEFTLGTYNIPRNVKGEGRILFIFSTKSLICSGIGALVGGVFYLIFSTLGLTMIGIIMVLLFALIGFVIGTFKMPDTQGLEITRKTGGENLDDIILRLIKFKMKKNKLYIYAKEETKDE